MSSGSHCFGEMAAQSVRIFRDASNPGSGRLLPIFTRQAHHAGLKSGLGQTELHLDHLSPVVELASQRVVDTHSFAWNTRRKIVHTE